MPGAGQRHARGGARLRDRRDHAASASSSSTRTCRRGKGGALAAMDDRVDKKHAAIKLYLAKVTSIETDRGRGAALPGTDRRLRQAGTGRRHHRAQHAGPCAQEARPRLEFTDEGWRELLAFHASVLANARLAFNVLVSRDAEPRASWSREGPAARSGESARARAISPGCAKARPRASRPAPSTSTRSATSSRSTRCSPPWPTRCSRNRACSRVAAEGRLRAR
jgi:hypothetical protein